MNCFMCHFKALCAVKYDGGYERAEGREAEKGRRRASERLLVWSSLWCLHWLGAECGTHWRVGLVSWWEYEAGCAVRVNEKIKTRNRTFAQIFFWCVCVCAHVFIFKHECAFCSTKRSLLSQWARFHFSPVMSLISLCFMSRSVTSPHWVAW